MKKGLIRGKVRTMKKIVSINPAKALQRKKKELGETITMEMGKTIKESISEIEIFPNFFARTGIFLISK